MKRSRSISSSVRQNPDNDAVNLEFGLRRAKSNANRYHSVFSGYSSFDFNDLYGWGCLGVADALRHYNPSRAKFTTFCELKIRHHIANGVQGIVGRASTVYRPPLQSNMLPIEHCNSNVLDQYTQSPSTQFDDLLREEEAAEIRRIVASLPQKMAKAVYLSYWKGLTYAEIGQILGVSTARIGQLMQESIVKIDKRWRRRMMKVICTRV